MLPEMSSVEEHMDEGEDQRDLVVSDSAESESIEQLGKYLIEKLSHLDLSKKGVTRIGDLPIAANGGFSLIYRGSYRRKEVAIKIARQTMQVDQNVRSSSMISR